METSRRHVGNANFLLDLSPIGHYSSKLF